MGVDVLVLVVLVDLHPHGGHLRQHDVGDPDLDQPLQTGDRVRSQHELAQFVADPLGGDDREPIGPRAHRRDQLGYRGEAQGRLEPGGPQDAQRVVVERRLGACGGTQHAAGEICHPAEQVDEVMAGHGHRHRIHGEVPPGQVRLQAVAVGHGRVAGLPVVRLTTVGGDLEPDTVPSEPDRAEGDSGLPGRLRPSSGDLQNPLGASIRGEVEIGWCGPGHGGRRPAEQGVPYRTTDEVKEVTVRGEDATELIGGRRHPQQLTHHPFGRVSRIVQTDH